MMKMFFAIGAMACVALPAAAHASGKPIACLYDHVAHNDKIDHDSLQALVARDMVAETNDQKIAMARIGSEMGKCQAQYGWSRERQHAVFGYLHARLLFDSQSDMLAAHGITYQMITGVAGGMAPDVRNTYLNGTGSRAMIGDAVASLRAAGGTIDDAAAADQAFEVALGKALVASIAEADDEHSFAAR
jgi:hypothetical protein